jgi:hypothetical protein
MMYSRYVKKQQRDDSENFVFAMGNVRFWEVLFAHQPDRYQLELRLMQPGVWDEISGTGG